MAKLGMKPVPGIIRVTVKKSKNILFVIKAEIEDLSAQATSAAAEQFKAPGSDYTPPTFGGDDVTEVTAEGDDDGDEDAGALDENDIELVVKQAGVSKAKAIKALKQNENDVVNAIMALSG